MELEAYLVARGYGQISLNNANCYLLNKVSLSLRKLIGNCVN